MLKLKSALMLSCLLVIGCGESITANGVACDVSSIDRTALEAARTDSFQSLPETEFAALIASLANCLGHADPDIRDSLSYGTLTEMLRSGAASPGILRSLRDSLFTQLDGADPEGFTHPFAALVLAEVSRVDRVSPYLSDAERDAMVQRAAAYVSAERDYRGFSDEDGWRHGVAHGADWLMQLALNPALNDDHRILIYDAVTSQVQAGDGHAYVFGEPERLARPYLFAAMRDSVNEATWTERLERASDPAPLSDWSEAFNSESDLARLHNVKGFLRVLLVNVTFSDNPSLKAMEPAIITVMRTLPA